MNKRGQFYLIATLVIIGIIAGLAATYNKAVVRPTFSKQEALTNEMQFELNKVIENGLYNNLPQSEIDAHLREITDHYGRTNRDTYLLFIIGDKTTLNLYSYNNDKTNPLSISHETQSIQTDETPIETTDTFTRQSDELTITLSNGKTFTKELEDTVIVVFTKKETDGETFVKISK